MSKKKDPALLTKEKIRKLKEKEQEAKNFYGFLELAEFVAKAGYKDWACELYKKGEGLANDSTYYRWIAESIASEDYLGDKEWARKLYKKAEGLAEIAEKSSDDQHLAESIANEDYLGDKDWARKLYKKAEELAEESFDYKDLAESIANKNYLGDKEWAQDILKKENKMRDITMEIFDEEHQQIVNKINFSTNQELDVSNFNADDYLDLIRKENFLEDVKEAIMKSDTWRWDYNQENSPKPNFDFMTKEDIIKYYTLKWNYNQENSQKPDFDFMKKVVGNDAIMIRFTKIRDLDLSFLSVKNEFAEKTAEHEQLLKGTIFESNLSDDDFEDAWNDFLMNALLSLNHILTL